MDCASYSSQGLIIGSGPVGAAAKTHVGHCLKRNGMRWTSQGRQQILNLRVHVQSNGWDAFRNWYLQTAWLELQAGRRGTGAPQEHLLSEDQGLRR